ncbi:MAG TPA: hypothetical protein VGQ49_20105 [Bryobacteraceae bacterium]|nr:hypothetical protein [Bryobacteraceae bacterium]
MKRRLKLVLCLAFIGAFASAQSASTTYSKDLNGNRVEGKLLNTSPSGEVTERFQSMNGRQVPVEQVTERVVSQDANGKVTERIVRKFDPTGQPALTERVMIEENKLPGGGSTVRETTYRNDTNGGLREAERKTTETRVSGSTTTSSTTIDRPGMSGSFETVEKRSAVTEGPAANQHTTESVYSRDVSGGFKESVRLVSTASTVNDATKESTAIYEPGLNGQLQLDSQTESTTSKQPDGTQRTETNVFAKTVAGNVQDSSGGLRVKEQEILQRRANPDGSVVEIVSVRRPAVSDPNRLGDLQKVSETLCKGKCQPDKAKPAAEIAKP